MQRCRCGSSTCRGVLGPKPKDVKSAPEGSIKPAKKSMKRKIQEAVSAPTLTRETSNKKQRTSATPSSQRSSITRGRRGVIISQTEPAAEPRPASSSSPPRNRSTGVEKSTGSSARIVTRSERGSLRMMMNKVKGRIDVVVKTASSTSSSSRPQPPDVSSSMSSRPRTKVSNNAVGSTVKRGLTRSLRTRKPPPTVVPGSSKGGSRLFGSQSTIRLIHDEADGCQGHEVEG